VIAAVLLSPSVSSASVANVYIAQNAAGSANGADCADALPLTWFNSAANWGSGSSQIGPDSTVHLCGTFTAPAGTNSYIAYQGDGISGHPVTVKLETGTVITSPYWGDGAIFGNGRNFIVLDGGTNGTITATNNGTNLGNQVDFGYGVDFSGSSNSEIKNMTITNIYVHVGGSSDTSGATSAGIFWNAGSFNKLDGNTIHDAGACIQDIFVNTGTTTDINIFNNDVSRCNWSIYLAAGSGGTTATLTGFTVHDNKVHDWGNWDITSGGNHHDGIFIVSSATNCNVTGGEVYNNLIYGNILSTMTGMIYVNPSCISGMFYFNNVMYDPSGAGFPADAYITDTTTSPTFLNNVCVGLANGSSGGSCFSFFGSTNVTAQNNIAMNCYAGFLGGPILNLATSDFNDINNCSDPFWIENVVDSTTLSRWQTFSGLDAHSTAANPLLNAGSTPPYQLTSTSSPAYRTGTNLTSLCGAHPALCKDATGASRPTTGRWDMGAYYLNSNAQPVAAPTGLTASGH